MSPARSVAFRLEKRGPSDDLGASRDAAARVPAGRAGLRPLSRLGAADYFVPLRLASVLHVALAGMSRGSRAGSCALLFLAGPGAALQYSHWYGAPAERRERATVRRSATPSTRRFDGTAEGPGYQIV